MSTSGTGFSLFGFLMGRRKSKADRLKPVLLFLLSCLSAHAQQPQQSMPSPETVLTDALSAACRQDSPAFANFLTMENATAFRALPGPQRTAMMKRFVLLEEPGRALLSTGGSGQKIVRCRKVWLHDGNAIWRNACA